MSGTFSNRKAVVTGASRGIGLAIATELLSRECQVTGLARTAPPFERDNPLLTFEPVDFSKLDNLPDKLKAIHKTTGDIDILVCNAGLGRFGSLEEFSAMQIRELIDINLTSQILTIREFLPGLRRRRGHIIVIGSEAALAGARRGVVYSATKFALRGVAQSLREETASSGLRVTIVNPGMVETDFFNALDFSPGSDPDCHLTASDVASAVMGALEARDGCCLDEINLSPQKKVIDFGKKAT